MIEGAHGYLPLAGVVDLAEERARLEKEREEAAKQIAGTEKKLANEQFVSKAPKEVVEQQRERLAEAKAKSEKLAAAIERLKAV